MDPEIRHSLAELIRTEGVGLADDPQRVKALLMDLCPDSRTELGLLVAATEDEIPSRLLRSSDSVFREGEMARAIVDLQRDRRLDRPAAEWVVRSWAWALGVVEDEPDDRADAIATDASTQVSIGQPGVDPTTSSVGPEQRPQYSTGSVGTWQHSSGGQLGPQSGDWHGVAHPSGPPGGGPPPLNAPSSGVPLVPQQWIPTGQHPPAVPPWTPPGVPTGPGQPPRKRRTGLLVGIFAAVVLLCGGLALTVALLPEPPQPPPSSGPSAPAPPTTAATVGFVITDQLVSPEISETVSVSFNGQKVGTLKIDTTARSDHINVTGLDGSGVYNYEIDVTIWYTDSNGTVQQANTSGSGTINVYEGATYAVDLVERGDSFVATLRAP